jgi:hypothetical protein
VNNVSRRQNTPEDEPAGGWLIPARLDGSRDAMEGQTVSEATPCEARREMSADGPGAEDYDAHRFMRGTPESSSPPAPYWIHATLVGRGP